jgi:hypothetical protein
MKIKLLTTIDTNIGDDFIRQGLINVIYDIDQRVTLENFNKHVPYSLVKPGFFLFCWKVLGRLPFLRKSKRIKSFLLSHMKSVFHDCDLVVQCGAPVIWPSCDHAEWKPFFWEKMTQVPSPILNLGGGSCFPILGEPHLSESDEKYIKLMCDQSTLTSCRDKLALTFFSKYLNDTQLIPCSASLSSLHLNREYRSQKKYIIINYMQGGGHFDWGQNINDEKWSKTILSIYEHLISEGKEVRFICHSDIEVKLLTEGFSGALSKVNIVTPTSIEEYYEVVKDAEYGICNRMHASVFLAGLGIPSIAVCTDTRLNMVDEFKQPTLYVEDATFEKVVKMFTDFEQNWNEIHDELLLQREDTFNKYREIFSKFIKKA